MVFGWKLYSHSFRLRKCYGDGMIMSMVIDMLVAGMCFSRDSKNIYDKQHRITLKCVSVLHHLDDHQDLF